MMRFDREVLRSFSAFRKARSSRSISHASGNGQAEAVDGSDKIVPDPPGNDATT